MKKLLIIWLLAVSVGSFAQTQLFDCNGDQVSFYNVTCTDDVLHFTVTATNLVSSATISPLPLGTNSTPVTGSSSLIFSMGPFGGSSGSFFIGPGNATALLSVPSEGCTEALNTTLRFEEDCEGNPFSLIIAPAPIVPIPTIGQWGIIFLALLIAIGGIITSRKRLLAAE